MRLRSSIGGLAVGLMMATSACTFSPSARNNTGAGGARVGNPGLGGSLSLPPTPCEGLSCRQSTCAAGSCAQPKCTTGQGFTSLSGTIYDPAGRVPLYNVDVYVPSQPLADYTDGPSCDSCSNRYSGSPVVTATTDTHGHFKLGDASADVPAGADIPLVIQLGKWRRVITIPNVTACQDTGLTDPATMRLPANQSEGHLPKIALTTGGLDALECLLRKIGISDAEFTPESGPGRVNLFAGGTHDGTAMSNVSAGTNAYDPSLNGGAAFTDAEVWWESASNLSHYDIVLHSCDGTENPTNKSMNARQALQSFADVGGRVFASHWHNYWIEHGPTPWPGLANFNHQRDPTNPFTATIDTGFEKGAALADWLFNVGGSTTLGQLVIQGAKHTVDSVNAPSQRWIYSTRPTSTQYFSFTTPATVGAPACGKVVFSDLHVSAGTGGADNDSSAPSKPFPTGCVTQELSPQEKTLEFMLFDLSSCINEVG
jgi:hypothetical protein